MVSQYLLSLPPSLQLEDSYEVKYEAIKRT